ncbi:hypothetical protein XHV734_3693 [Xanthomonas hortorum pv. vitians]|nr:hypothetical protein XHV734_3693 [Xanthomonas hortorum pv. vitians]
MGQVIATRSFNGRALEWAAMRVRRDRITNVAATMSCGLRRWFVTADRESCVLNDALPSPVLVS